MEVEDLEWALHARQGELALLKQSGEIGLVRRPAARAGLDDQEVAILDALIGEGVAARDVVDVQRLLAELRLADVEGPLGPDFGTLVSESRRDGASSWKVTALNYDIDTTGTVSAYAWAKLAKGVIGTDNVATYTPFQFDKLTSRIALQTSPIDAFGRSTGMKRIEPSSSFGMNAPSIDRQSLRRVTFGVHSSRVSRSQVSGS